MTTEDSIVHLFCLVDDRLGAQHKEPLAKLYPSEVVTIGVLFALKGVSFRAFERWLRRDWNALFGGLPERTRLLRLLRQYEHLTDALLGDPSLLCVADTLPIELLFPIRQGRSRQPLGTKGRDKGRWSVGVKWACVVNTLGDVCAWSWDGLHTYDGHFIALLETLQDESVVLADLGFRVRDHASPNVKLCPKGQWNERMTIETVFSMLTVVCHAKRMFHRAAHHLQAHLAYLAAAFNLCVALYHELHPDAHPYKLSIKDFCL